jgi:hypothetical protein
VYDLSATPKKTGPKFSLSAFSRRYIPELVGRVVGSATCGAVAVLGTGVSGSAGLSRYASRGGRTRSVVIVALCDVSVSEPLAEHLQPDVGWHCPLIRLLCGLFTAGVECDSQRG